MSENLEEVEYELDEGMFDGVEKESFPRSVEEEGLFEEEDGLSLLGSSDDAEKQRMYAEYLALLKDINCQNKMVADIKGQLAKLCSKECKTKCEIKNIRRLHNCLEQENLKLQCLINKAIALQNFGSKRHYKPIPIETSFDEDNLLYSGAIPQAVWKSADTSSDPCGVSVSGSTDSDGKDGICEIIKVLKKMNMSCPEGQKLIKQLEGIMKKKSNKSKKSDPCDKKRMQSSQIDPTADKMKKRLNCIQTEISRLQCEIARKQREGKRGDCLAKLKGQLCCLQSAVQELKCGICSKEKDRRSKSRRESQSVDCGDGGDGGYGGNWSPPDTCADDYNQKEDMDPSTICESKKNTKSDQLRKLKENFAHLLTEYVKKDSKLKELEQRLKGYLNSCGNGGNDNAGGGSEAELDLLRCRISELREEQDEFKCIMKEQAQQLEDYRQKYLTAQQKVEEQTAALEKLNMNNKRIEKQINAEVKEIRAKFQEKLTELLQYPKLLENEQCKLARANKEKEELEAKLAIVCKELRNMKTKQEDGKVDDCRPQLAQCTLELEQTKASMEELQRQRDLLCEEMQKVKDDLDTMRCESAKIIARTKERSDQMKQYQQEQINRLEKELAQCRATASLSVSDREAVIREMQGQLNTLAFSFDAAQKQIKTLRNHIAYVSNENCFSGVTA